MHKYTHTNVLINIEGGMFNTSTKVVKQLGWQVLLSNKKRREKNNQGLLPELQQG